MFSPAQGPIAAPEAVGEREKHANDCGHPAAGEPRRARSNRPIPPRAQPTPAAVGENRVRPVAVFPDRGDWISDRRSEPPASDNPGSRPGVGLPHPILGRSPPTPAVLVEGGWIPGSPGGNDSRAPRGRSGPDPGSCPAAGDGQAGRPNPGGADFQGPQQSQGLLPGGTADIRVRSKADADPGPVRMTIETAEAIRGQLPAAHPRRLAVRHTRDGRRDGGGDTTGPTAGPTEDFGFDPAHGLVLSGGWNRLPKS